MSTLLLARLDHGFSDSVVFLPLSASMRKLLRPDRSPVNSKGRKHDRGTSNVPNVSYPCKTVQSMILLDRDMNTDCLVSNVLGFYSSELSGPCRNTVGGTLLQGLKTLQVLDPTRQHSQV